MDTLLNILAEVIAYSHTLSAVCLGVSCAAMGMILKCRPESSAPDFFFVQTSRGLSVTAFFAMAWFIIAGAARVFLVIRAGGSQADALAGGIVLSLPLFVGPFFWFRLRRAVGRMKAGN